MPIPVLVEILDSQQCTMFLGSQFFSLSKPSKILSQSMSSPIVAYITRLGFAPTYAVLVEWRNSRQKKGNSYEALKRSREHDQMLHGPFDGGQKRNVVQTETPENSRQK